ncbi:hypothetical protein Curi_c15000 [Gottschalkia acidurici 9a]|uniref:Uncharacterized protein n=1 Tax=Gottschalkia acidurici (strain ATCC 7906 / DSM 604 / BCRC 14475 / CIP 104303 / KCTC 5404 / NCIMB 10678 / 9a) TaxID=1128398 RepID=K0AZ20_GOTA9|nr:hypothetical protein [Gottschalkia acidurici]AFS78509.1 hypothetical protein Curi_c15000 [Gottschalkia acidurici 9a]
MLRCSIDFLPAKESPQNFHLALEEYIKETDDEAVDFYIHCPDNLVMDNKIFEHIQGLISEVIKQSRNRGVDKKY